jgi:type I restriction enzyme S subunit
MDIMIDWLEPPRLPTDWRETTIGEAYVFTRRPRALRLVDYPTVPFVPMEMVPSQGATRIRWLDKAPDELTSGNYFERGDVLLSRITPSFENGKQGMADGLPLPFGFGSTELIPIQAKHGESDARFLFFLLLHPSLRAEVAARMEGSTGRQRVPESVVREWPILLPPLAEQRKIAAVLGKVQAAVEVEGELIRVTRELKQAALRQFFTRGLRGEPQKQTDLGPVPESWERVRVDGLGEVVTGTTPKTANRAFYDGGAIDFIAPGDISEDGTAIHSTAKKVTEAGLDAARELPRESSCFVCIGSSIGKVGITAQERAAFNQQINAVIPSEEFEAHFVFYTLLWNAESIASRASPSPVPIMSKSLFAEAPVWITRDKPEQREIAAHLAAIDAKLAHHEARQKLLRELFRTLLRDLMTARRRVTHLELPDHFADAGK